MNDEALIEWLRVKLAEAERTLVARKQSERTLRGGTDTSWRHAAEACGGKVMTKSERIEAAERESRIAGKCRRDVDMFKTLLVKVTQDPTAPGLRA